MGLATTQSGPRRIPALRTRSDVMKDYKKDYKEQGLALAGMLVVLLGVMFAAAATVA